MIQNNQHSLNQKNIHEPNTTWILEILIIKLKNLYE